MVRIAQKVDAGHVRKRLTRRESRAATRARLIESAGEVFAERGFYGASVEEITDRAGFSRGAFYSNFASREDLFLAVLDVYLDVELRALADALKRDAASPGALLEFLQSRAVRRSTGARQLTLLWAEFWLHVVRHPELAPKLAARQKAGRSAIARVIASQCDQFGFAPPCPPEHLASVMMAVDDGLVMQEFLDAEGLPEDLRARAAVMFFRGMAAESAELAASTPTSTPASTSTEQPARKADEEAETDRH
jgi:AcrR family transcriptional regulator